MAPKKDKPAAAAAPAKDAAAKKPAADKKPAAAAAAAPKDTKQQKPKDAAPKKDAPAAKAVVAAAPVAKAAVVAAAPAKAAPAAAAPKAVAPVAAAAAKPVAAAAAAPAEKKKEKKKPKVAGAAGAAKPKAAGAAKPKAAKAAAPQKQEQKDAPYLKKISKAKGEPATEIEQQVAKALLELEVSSKDLAADLTDLFIVSAKEVEVAAGKKAVVIFVPFRQHNKFKRIQSRIIRELEKKLSKNVVVLAQRTILSLNYSRVKKGELRPRSRTLTAVHQAILDDLVFPTLIVGKRTRVRLDGSKLLKVFLDPKDVKEVDYKLKTFAAIYKKLTCKSVEFIFQQEE